MRRPPRVRRHPPEKRRLLALVGGAGVGVFVYLVQYGVARAFDAFRGVGAMERIAGAPELYGGLMTVFPLALFAVGAAASVAAWRGRGLAAFATGAGAAALVLGQSVAGVLALGIGGVLLLFSVVWAALVA